MMLDRDDRLFLVGKALKRAVIQIHMRRHNPVHTVDINAKTMILRRDFHMSGVQIFDRMIAAVMTEFQLPRCAAKSMA